MSKRAAHSQITKNGTIMSDDEGSLSDVPSSAKVASSAVMATRKILKPRGTLPVKNGFSFSNVNGNTSNVFGGKPAEAITVSNGTNGTTSDRDNRIRALNDKFVESINKSNSPGTIANFTVIAQKYIDYYTGIEKSECSAVPTSTTFNYTQTAVPTPSTFPRTTTVPTSTSNPTAVSSNPNTLPKLPLPTPITKTAEPVNTQAANPFSFLAKPAAPAAAITVDSDSESEPEQVTKIEGPKFTLTAKPTVKKSPFTFGPKPVKKKADSDSDSDSEIELKGPTFTFNKVIKDSVFKVAPPASSTTPITFGTKDDKPASTTSSNDKITFGKQEEEATDLAKNDIDEKGPAKTATPAFNFGGSAKPAFKFGTTEPSAPKPFSLGNDTDKGKPFSFGSKPEESFKPFSFGSKPEEAAKPFSFGSKPEESTKPFSFGSKAGETKKPFSFGASSETSEVGSFGKQGENTIKPFSFGKSEDKPIAKPFSFGSNSSSTASAETAKPFSFGKSDVTFGAASEKSVDIVKPFSSDNKASEASPNPFSFKPSSSGNETSKSNPNPFGGAKEEDKPKPFSFAFGPAKTNENTPQLSNNFSFSAPKTVASEENKENTSELVEEEETGGNFKPIVQLSEKVVQGTGEEDEELTYTKRAKLMLYDSASSSYENKGTGDLKILKHTVTGKTRILIRADGGLRTIFNTLVMKDITYSAIGAGNMIKVPVINERKELETYVVQVKTASDGTDLLNAINNGKGQ